MGYTERKFHYEKLLLHPYGYLRSSKRKCHVGRNHPNHGRHERMGGSSISKNHEHKIQLFRR
nr:MAG TPA: hypothetical protein [Herelleviridae sp.]